MSPDPEPLDQAPAPRRIARRTAAFAVAAVLLLGAGAYVAADELGYMPAADTEAAETPSPVAAEAPSEAPAGEVEASAEPLVSDDPLDEVLFSEPQGGGGGRNVVRIENFRDDDLAVKAPIELNRITKSRAEPINFAHAYSSCVGCRTLAVALQINLVERNTPNVSPWNLAVAINERCTRCVTIAIALQYTFTVDDPKETPKEVRDLVKEMDRELRAISVDQSIDLFEAANRLDAVIARFQTLAASLDDRRDTARESTSPDSSSAPTEPPPTGDPGTEPTDPAPEPGASEPAAPSDAETPSPEPAATSEPSPSP